jgi:uncharacterized protein (TIGR02588 family)
MSMSKEGGSARSKALRETPLLEWLVGALSLLLVLGVAGFLLNDAFRSPPSPPRITFEVDSIVRAGRGYLVELRARNAGRTTAAGVEIEGELLGDTGTVETTGVTIDYVPAEGVTAAGLFFTEDPRQHRLEIRPKGYDRP